MTIFKALFTDQSNHKPAVTYAYTMKIVNSDLQMCLFILSHLRGVVIDDMLSNNLVNGRVSTAIFRSPKSCMIYVERSRPRGNCTHFDEWPWIVQSKSLVKMKTFGKNGFKNGDLWKPVVSHGLDERKWMFWKPLCGKHYSLRKH